MASPVYDDEKHRTGAAPLVPKDKKSVDASIDDMERHYDEDGSVAQEDQNIARATDIANQEREAAKGNVKQSYSPTGSGSTQSDSTKAGSTKADKGQDADGNGKSSDRLSKQESQGGGFYRQENSKKRGNLLNKSFKIMGKQVKAKIALAVGAAIGGAILSMVIAALVALPGMKLFGIVERLMARAGYAAASNAVENVGQRMMTSYIVHKVIPSLDGNCPSTNVNRSCLGPIREEGPLGDRYRRWAGQDSSARRIQRLEYAMAQKGYEIYRSGNSYRMRAPGLNNPVPLDDLLNGRTANLFNMPELNRGEASLLARQALLDTYRDVTGIKGSWYRFQGMRALQAKYGLVRCLRDCSFSNRAALVYSALALQDQRKLGVGWALRRIEPHSQMAAVALNCLINPCNDELTSDGLRDSDNTNGEPMDQFRRESRRILFNFANEHGNDKLQDIVRRTDEFQRDRKGYFIRMSVRGLGGGDGAARYTQELVRQIGPPIKWLILVAQVAVVVEILPQIAGFVYTMNSALMVQQFGIAQTITHEAKAGQMDDAAFGGTTSLMNYGTGGNGLPAEASPLYDQLFDGNRAGPAAALMRTMLPQTAYAQAGTAADADAKSYRCKDGKTIYQHALEPGNPQSSVCPEERLIYKSSVIDGAKAISQLPGFQILVTVAAPIIAVIDALGDAIGPALEEALRAIPGVSALLDGLQLLVAEYLMPWIIGTLFPNPMAPSDTTGQVDGAKNFNNWAGGADVGGNYMAHRALGGERLTTSESTAIMEAENQKRLDSFAVMPLSERLFSTTNTYSLAGQIALAAPTDISGAARTALGSLLSNPIGKLTGSVASLFTLGTVNAQSYLGSAHGVTQYGVPINHPAMKDDVDIQEYWEANCSEENFAKIGQAYNTAKIDAGDQDDPEMEQLVLRYGYFKNPDTGEVENDETNFCFTIKSVASYDQDPPASEAGAPATPPGGGLTGANCNDVASCAQKLLDLAGSGQINLNPGPRRDLESAVGGTPITACGTSQLNLTMLQVANIMASKYKFYITSLISGRDGCDGGRHPPGRAFDVDLVNGVDAQPSAFKTDPYASFGRDAMATIPPGGGLGQKECFGDVGDTTGKNLFDDPCNHVHIDVGTQAP